MKCDRFLKTHCVWYITRLYVQTRRHRSEIFTCPIDLQQTKSVDKKGATVDENRTLPNTSSFNDLGGSRAAFALYLQWWKFRSNFIIKIYFFVHKDIVMYAWSWFSIIFLRFYFGFFILWTLYLKGEGNCACLEVYFLARYTLLLLSLLSRKSFFPSRLLHDIFCLFDVFVFN